MTADFLHMQTNQQFEQECYEQAKQEIGNGVTGMDFITKVLTRAQEIKMERKANLLTPAEVLANVAKAGK